MVNKLRRLRLRDCAVRLLDSYLDGRLQRFRVSSTITPSIVVPCGVPQGSVLGPLLYICYTNDLFLQGELGGSVRSSILSFADDTVLLLRSKSTEDLSHSGSIMMTNISRWLHTNGLVLNARKTKVMTFPGQGSAAAETQPSIYVHSSECSTVNCQCVTLEQVTSYVYLGLTLQSNMRYDIHINKVKNRVRAGVAILARMRKVASVAVRKVIYFSLVESHLRYMLSVFGGTFKTALDPLIKVQKKAIRHVARTDALAHTAPLFHSLNILDLNRLYLMSVAKTMIYKNLLIQRPSHYHETRFREEGNLLHPTFVKSISRKTAGYHIVTLFNVFPSGLKQLYENP